MDEVHRPEQDQEKYSFMQESIKDEKFDYKKVLKKVAKLAGKGIVFGLAASIGFFALKPWIETTFQNNTTKVEIPKDDEIEEANQPKDTTTVEEELTIENYRELNKALGQVALEVKKSMVLVNGIHQDESWGNEQNSSSYQTPGVIIADSGRELLILTNYFDMKNAHLFQVKFADGTEYEAVMKQKDGNMDMAVLSVSKSGITEETWSKIKVAVLGNSNTFAQGKPLIAAGSPFGYEDGIGYGIASSVNQTVVRADGEYAVLITDMPGAKDGKGVLFDINARVIGIIDSKLAGEAGSGSLKAIGISSIKSEIELMLNGKNVPYVGIIGTMITEGMSNTHGVPTGLFVTEVEVDSPAMKAGIQNGDIITKISERTISSFADYHNAILTQEAGETIEVLGQRQGAENYVDIKFDVTVGVKQ